MGWWVLYCDVTVLGTFGLVGNFMFLFCADLKKGSPIFSFSQQGKNLEKELHYSLCREIVSLSPLMCLTGSDPCKQEGTA